MRKIGELTNDIVIHKQTDQIEYLQFRKLLEYSYSIEHAYTLKPLDFRKKNNNLLDSALKIARALDFNVNSVVRPMQTHSNHVKCIDKVTEHNNIYQNEELEDTDGILTNQKEVVLSIQTADCIALLLYDPVGKVIANIHSGWRGTLGKIAQKAVYEMILQYGSKPENMICCICPSIRKCHFEVEEEVQRQFEETFAYMRTIRRSYFLPRKQRR